MITDIDVWKWMLMIWIISQRMLKLIILLNAVEFQKTCVDSISHPQY